MAFKAAWQRSYGLSASPFADEMDLVLHRARFDRMKGKFTYETALKSLPDGCFVEIDGQPWLVWREALLLWTPEGYARREFRPADLKVSVLTPQPIVECFREGYKPEIHNSWRSL